MSSEIHLNDIGTKFNITVYDETDSLVNLSGATTTDILLRSPADITYTKTGLLVDNGISGVMQYTTVSGDLNQVGIWQIQGHVIFGSYALYTNVSNFRVHNNVC